jgi:hypothetical protein
MNGEPLRRIVDEEMRRSVPAAVSALAAQLATRAQGQAAAVLFYGSNLRDARLDGVLDFYILLDHVGAWPGSRLAALANRMLPPNVGYFEGEVAGQTLRAKYALLSVSQFRRGMSRSSLDTTLWARFSQPCCLAWVRSEVDRAAAVDSVRKAVMTAARWAAAAVEPATRARRGVDRHAVGDPSRSAPDLEGSDAPPATPTVLTAGATCPFAIDSTAVAASTPASRTPAKKAPARSRT